MYLRKLELSVKFKDDDFFSDLLSAIQDLTKCVNISNIYFSLLIIVYYWILKRLFFVQSSLLVSAIAIKKEPRVLDYLGSRSEGVLHYIFNIFEVNVELVRWFLASLFSLCFAFFLFLRLTTAYFSM